jgi:hypothetical protein
VLGRDTKTANMNTSDRPVIDDCPWQRRHVKHVVKRTIDAMGGRLAFDFVGPAVQRAVIVKACWDTVQAAMPPGESGVAITPKGFAAIERAFCEEAGIWPADDE